MNMKRGKNTNLVQQEHMGTIMNSFEITNILVCILLVSSMLVKLPHISLSKTSICGTFSSKGHKFDNPSWPANEALHAEV